MPTLGFPEILGLLLLALLLFGPGRIKKLARELGGSLRAFQEAYRGEEKADPEREDESKA